MSQSDPTDNALAAIASILDQTTLPPEQAKEYGLEHATEDAVAMPPPLPHQAEQAPSDPAPPRPIEAHGYSKAGPGPMAALRFRWTVREDDGRYFVDETVGDAPPARVNGPMTKDEAIKFVDDREAEAQQRFDRLKAAMTNGN